MLWVIIPLMMMAALFLLIKLAKRGKNAKKSAKKKKKAKGIEMHLLESEEAVMKAVKSGAVWQKHIQLKTGFSKAKLSRTLRNLEARRLIKRIPIGNTNKIRLLNK